MDIDIQKGAIRQERSRNLGLGQRFIALFHLAWYPLFNLFAIESNIILSVNVTFLNEHRSSNQ